MSQVPSVVLLDSDILAARAHDLKNREAATGTPASLDSLESLHTLSLSPEAPLASPPLPQHISHDINNGVLPVGVTTSSSAHDQSSLNPANVDDHDQGMSPNSSTEYLHGGAFVF
jgi:hypothetical protein